jgi:hypothetical protein
MPDNTKKYRQRGEPNGPVFTVDRIEDNFDFGGSSGHGRQNRVIIIREDTGQVSGIAQKTFDEQYEESPL